MRTRWKVLLALIALIGVGAAGYQPAVQYWRIRSVPKWKTVEVGRGGIVAVVNSTGTVNPQQTLLVGSFVSGPIDGTYELKNAAGQPMLGRDGQPLNLAEFNQEVKEGDELAKIDERIYLANRERDKATYESRLAEVERAKAVHEQSERDLQRAVELRKRDVAFVAQSEMDQLYFAVKQNKAAVALAEKAAAQAFSQLENSETNLEYCTILAPKDGIIITRKIEPGQTLASQFQTPELFVLGLNMRGTVHIYAAVDEADIGLIKKAQQEGRSVKFTVDAYPDKLFEGPDVRIEEIRMNSAISQNIVSYPVIVSAPNPDLRLLPGMTATISFDVDSRDNVLKIPNAALRYYPQDLRHVRPEDRPLLEGKIEQASPETQEESSENDLSASQRAELRRKRNRRHVWVADGVYLKAVELVIGLADSQFTELVEGNIQEGDVLVTGIQSTTSVFGGQ
ncbi:MAG TPA: efflux RND transporter periplasmic adaptor subunit [Pirellulaceae bacterium]|nr:efflux RND transporter periplasmic adaptor subunit [Pirellulaceae bacterium]